MFALMDIAIADAGIVAWDAKYFYNYQRPIDGIRQAATDGNAATVPDAGWEPLLTTPNFPAYVSGHSVFGAAASTVLAALYGDNTTFTTHARNEPEVTRSYTSFSTASAENALSRVFGGVHWDFDAIAGGISGTALGNLVAGNFLRPRP